MSKKIFIPTINADRTEGRGPMIPEPYGFESEAFAYTWLVEKYGANNAKHFGGFIPVEVCTCIEDALTTDRVARRKAVWNKLTQEERDLLGISKL